MSASWSIAVLLISHSMIATLALSIIVNSKALRLGS
jgi:hypothetical protein